MQALVTALLELAPSLGPLGAVLLIIVAIAAFGVSLTAAIQRTKAANVTEALQGLRDVLGVVMSMLDTTAAREVVQTLSTTVSNFRYFTVRDLSVQASVILTREKLSFYLTQEDADAFKAILDECYLRGIVTLEQYTPALKHYGDETIRMYIGVTVYGAASDPLLVERLKTLPSFDSIDDAVLFSSVTLTQYNTGWLTAAGLERVVTWCNAEIARLLAVAPPVVVPPPVAPPVTFPPEFIAWQTAVADAITSFRALIGELQAEGKLTAGQIALADAQVTALTALAAKPFPTTLETPGLTEAVKALLSAITTLGTMEIPRLREEVKTLTGTLTVPGVGDVYKELGLTTSLPSALVGTNIGSLAGAIAEATFFRAGPTAHAAQTARYGCMGGFGDALMGLIRNVLPGVVPAALLFFKSPLRDFVEGQGREILTTLADPKLLPAPASEDTALASATSRITQAIGFGLSAQLMSYSAEVMTPLKNMGFNQLAGFLGDLAGFKRVADGLMGTIETAGIYTPLRWAAQRRFRPTIPAGALIEAMYAKYALTKEEVRDYLERSGYDDTVISRLPNFLFRDPRFGELIRAFQLKAPTFGPEPDAESLAILQRAGVKIDADWYYKVKLAKSGLEPIDIEFMTPVVKMGVVRREQTLRYGQISRLYREGFLDRDRSRKEIEEANKPADAVEYRLAAMDLEREYEDKVDWEAVILKAWNKGVIGAVDCSRGLGQIGLDAPRQNLLMLKERLAIQPRIRVEETTEPPTPVVA